MSAVSPTAFESFFHENVDFVVRTLRRFGVDARDVEDVAQEVFVVAMRRTEPLAEAWTPRAYLWGVSRRLAADYRRLARHRTTLVEQVETSAPSHRYEVTQIVHRALAALPEDRRDVLVLFEIEGWTLDEIALAVGIPSNTVSSRLRRARQEFEDAVVDLERGDGAALELRGRAAREGAR